MAPRSNFLSFLHINAVFYPVFDLSICGQVPGNAYFILTVPYAVFEVKSCHEIGNQMERPPHKYQM
jgi:hypothetical protein